MSSTTQRLPLPLPTTSWTVNDVLRYHPVAASVFNAFGLDMCCGGNLTLDDAARDASCAPATLIEALESRIALVASESDAGRETTRGIA